MNIDNEDEAASDFQAVLSAKDMIEYLKKYHDENLHDDYIRHLETFDRFVLSTVEVNSIASHLPHLDEEKVKAYKVLNVSSAPPIVIGDNHLIDGYHRVNAAKEVGIITLRAYLGIHD